MSGSIFERVDYGVVLLAFLYFLSNSGLSSCRALTLIWGEGNSFSKMAKLGLCSGQVLTGPPGGIQGSQTEDKSNSESLRGSRSQDKGVEHIQVSSVKVSPVTG